MIRVRIPLVYGTVQVSRAKRDKLVGLNLEHDGPVAPNAIYKELTPAQARNLARQLVRAATGE